MRLYDNFSPQTMDGNLLRGGWQVMGRVNQDYDGIQFGQNLQLMGRNLSGTVIDPEFSEFFNGHAMGGISSYSFSKFQSEGQIKVGTADNLLKGHLQDIGFTDQASPLNDHQITAMNIGKIIDHIVRRHCNAIYDPTQTPDGVVLSTSINTATSTPVDEFDVRKSNNLWRRVQEIGGGVKGGELGIPYFKRDNSLVYDFNPFTTLPASKGIIDEGLITGPVRINFGDSNPLTRIGQVEVVTKGNTGVEVVFTGKYPADQDRGKYFIIGSGLWANNQAAADTMAQSIYEWYTRVFTLFVPVDPNLLLYGDDGVGLDLGDVVTVVYDGVVNDGVSGFDLSINHYGIIYGAVIRFQPDEDNAQCILQLECKAV